MTKPYCSECNQDREIADLRALLAAQEARAQRVEQAARALVEQVSSGRETYRGLGRQVICEVSEAWVTALRAALSQPAAKESK
jgi:thioredoxin-like negative regulator of GroEL